MLTPGILLAVLSLEVYSFLWIAAILFPCAIVERARVRQLARLHRYGFDDLAIHQLERTGSFAIEYLDYLKSHADQQTRDDASRTLASLRIRLSRPTQNEEASN